MSVRLRRLKADYDRLCTLFTQKSRIHIKKSLGDPPEKYQIEYLVKGLEKAMDGQIHIRNTFLVEINLTAAYPRLAPQCRMLTPVFHPNIAPHAICIGDHWAAGESLANLIVRIAEMLSYQSYNVKSPLNGEAAKWVEENSASLPLDTFDFGSMLAVGEAVGRSSDGKMLAGDTCANCGKNGSTESMSVCLNSHVCCENCKLHCQLCDAVVCLKCALLTCASCKAVTCQKCAMKCASCQQTTCMRHQARCSICEHSRCMDCIVECQACGKSTCLEHIQKVKSGAGSQMFCTRCAPAVMVNS
ncbi:MAG TPA: ubiquitin-conjugating enzyme E2 [Planctomycetota bacterium]|nr:ubiquitin-conjugating enzyme E2 [Planctomycetota bacterium]